MKKEHTTNIEAVRKYIQEKHPGFPVPEKSYLILMIPRTGSNLLASHLESIGFGNPVEAFHFNRMNPTAGYKENIDFSDPAAYMRHAIQMQTVNGTFGMKLNWQQLSTFQKTARQITAPANLELDDKDLFEVFFPDAKFIYMKRLDKVKQAISYSKGMQTGIWKERVGEDQTYKKYVLPPVYDRAHIEGCLEELLAFDNCWENFLKRGNIPYLEIWYEDLARDFVSSMKEIYDFLGVDKEEVPQPVLRKQANKRSQDWKKRFITETPWLAQEPIKTALQEGDFYTAFILRGTSLFQQKESHSFRSMPSTRFKPIRKFLLRVKRKLSSLLSRE